jgi:uncharacterized protein YraI
VGGLLLGLALPASADAYYAGTEGAVTLRAGPGVNFKRLAVIPRGASIWIVFCQPRWCKATWRGITGWVSAAYVSGHYVEQRQPYPDYGLFDDYYYDYYFYPHRPHRRHHHPHCKSGYDCKPPKWDKPWQGKPPRWNKPWDGNSPKWNKPNDGSSKKWEKDWDQSGQPKAWKQNDGPKNWGQSGNSDGPRFRDNNGPSGGNFNFRDNDGDRGGRSGNRKWEDD